MAACLAPTSAIAQGEVTTGLLVIPEQGVGGRQVGPAVSVAASRTLLGVGLRLEVGAARTDFSSLGQDYHDNHYFLSLGPEWFATRGATRIGLRLGVGAYGEYQTVETNPSSPGGDNWVEALIPGLALEHDLGGRRRLVLGITDFVIGPYFAVLDPAEYGVEHRIRVMVGVRF